MPVIRSWNAREETHTMANQKHLQILKQGIEAWNEWRDQHRDARSALAGANFSLTNLNG
jgi:hypothetical protein